MPNTLHPIRVGVGGWVYEPWDETFYPADLSKKKQLEFASRALTAIEINGTFYRGQTEATFQKWASETPDDFQFTVKAHRATTHRKSAAEAIESVGWFLDGGVTALGEKLGAINWQFAPTKKFDAEFFAAFLAALPAEKNKTRLRHAIEVRHASFNDPAFFDMLRKHKCALVSSDDPDWPQDDVQTADFAYARLQQSQAGEKAGYPAKEITGWAKTFQKWAQTRAVFAFLISGAKERNPAGAMALIKKLKA